VKFVAVAALLLVFAILAAQARPLDWVMRFKGNSKKSSQGFFSIKGPSQTIETLVNAKDAIHFAVHDTIGSFATINAHETSFSNSTFTSTGNITFGTHQFQSTHVLFYKTLGLGHTTKAPHTNEVALSTIWNVFSGKGVFSGAYGTVAVTCRMIVQQTDDLLCFAIGQVFLP